MSDNKVQVAASKYMSSPTTPSFADMDRIAKVGKATLTYLADIYRATGSDPDGNEDWRLAGSVLNAVKSVMEDHERECDRYEDTITQLTAERDKLAAEVEGLRKQLPPKAVDPRTSDRSELVRYLRARRGG